MSSIKVLRVESIVVSGLILLFLTLAAATSSLWAATIYVSPFGSGSGTGVDSNNTATLPNALNTARSNGQDDVLYLRADGYTFSATYSYTPNASDYSTSIKIIGGWNSTYTYKNLDPLATRLYGGGAGGGRIFDIAANTAGMSFSVSFENITFQNGNVAAATGAAIRAISSGGGIISQLSVSHCNFLQNTTTSTGGAIYANCYAEITDSAFSYNSANTGGAIALVPPETTPPFTVSLSPKIDRCSFENNVSGNSSSGSDIYSTVSPVIRSCSFRGKDNGTNNGGAAIHHRRHYPGNYSFPPPANCGTPGGTPEYVGKLTVINSTFSGKRSYYWGGAISLWDSDTDIVNSLFVDNHAGLSTEDYGCGGGITIYDDCFNTTRTVRVLNSTFAKNRSFAGGDFCNGTNGQAIHNRTQNLRVVNSVFWDNGTNSIYNNGSLTVEYSNLEQAYSGTGNKSMDPLFVDFTLNNFRLGALSPLIDQGTNNPLGTFLYELYPTSSDLDGLQRIIDTVDMGAYEFNNLPYANATGRGDPNLAYDPVNNRFLAVYNKLDGVGSGYLYGRLINPDGTPNAAEFQISEQNSYKRLLSAVTYDTFNQKFVVVWDVFNASSNDSDIQGQMINPDGTLEGWNFTVSNKAGVEEMEPAIAYDSTNHQTLAVWSKHDFPTDNDDVYGRLFIKDIAQGSDEVAIAAVPGSSQNAPDVAFDPINNRYLVVWTDDRDYTAQIAGEIYGQRVAATGSLVGDNFRITDNGGQPTNAYQFYPAVAFNPATQKFLVVWEDGQIGTNLYGRAVNGDGTLPGAIFPVTVSPSDQWGVSLAFDNQKNRFLAVWADNRNSGATGRDIYGQWFNAEGLPFWPNFGAVRTANDQQNAKAAYGSGGFLVAYEYTTGPTSFEVGFKAIVDTGFLFLPLIVK